MGNAVMLVWGTLRLAPISQHQTTKQLMLVPDGKGLVLRLQKEQVDITLLWSYVKYSAVYYLHMT